MRRTLALFTLALLAPSVAFAQRMRPDSALLTALRWRSIGPANMAGRVSDVEANPRNPKVFYVAYATGGVWKTVNAGTTWQPIFDNTGAHSVSELAIAPSDTSIVWAGTGEEDSRNSISPGSGVFKSTNGGRTWTNMGLRESHHIGRILVHPTNADIVYVAALGHAWGPNPERGLYKTTDGGQSWTRVRFVSDRAGFVDIAMDPTNPDVLIATSWERQRGPYFLRSGGPGSGIWRTTDGGANWTRITGNGLPTTTLGRIGVAIAPSDPRIVYAIVEADSNPNPESVRQAQQRGFVPDTTRRQQLQSGMFRSEDGGLTWTRMNRQNNRPFYYSQLRVDPRNSNRVYWLATQFSYSNDGGLTLRRLGQGIHVDYHAMWINPGDPDHFIVGQDGGIGITYDRGRTFDAAQQVAVGQFYGIGVDMQKPFWVCGGLQDNGTWCGPSSSIWSAGIRNQNWIKVGGGDGFYAAMDPTNPDMVYSESQGGNITRVNLRTWERRVIRPMGLPLAPLLEDSIIIARGDTAAPPPPETQRVIDSLRVRARADSLSRPRFNWSSPFFISPHNPSTLYVGGNRLFKSVDRGDHWVPISEDLSTRDSVRIRTSIRTTGGVTRDVTGAETHGTITTVAESPIRPGILWAGTDDGNVWLSANDGATWTNLTGRLPGVPPKTWVSRVEPSNFDSATAYVSFDGHRDDNFRPYVFVTNDFGRTFRNIAADLPASEYVHVVREHPRRRELLFVGTELAAYVSTDAGGSWIRLMSGMPPVPVHDLVIHPRDKALVAATHGRSIFVMDIGPLEEATDSILAAPSHLFAVETALLYHERGVGGGGGGDAVGHKIFSAPNAPFGARIAFRIAGPSTPADTIVVAAGADGDSAEGMASDPPASRSPRGPRVDSLVFVITNAQGDTVRTLRAQGGVAALRWVTWDLRRNRPPLGPAARRDSIRVAQRQAFLRDSVRAAVRDTAAGRPRLLPGRDPEPAEPGTPVLPPGFGPPSGFGGGGGFRGLGQAPMVEQGIYFVTVRLGGVEHRRVIRVERPDGPRSAIAGDWH